MSNLLELIQSQISPEIIAKISSQLKADPAKTASAVSAGLPALMAGMAKNTKSETGSNSLATALDKDHDGSIFNNVDDFLGNAQNGPGNGIMKHVFGDKKEVVETTVSKQSGLDASQVSNVFSMIAPMVMGALGKQKKEQGLDANGLSQMLSAAKPQASGGIAGMLSFLDKDGDGDIMDDVKGMVSGLFGKK